LSNLQGKLLIYKHFLFLVQKYYLLIIMKLNQYVLNVRKSRIFVIMVSKLGYYEQITSSLEAFLFKRASKDSNFGTSTHISHHFI